MTARFSRPRLAAAAVLFPLVLGTGCAAESADEAPPSAEPRPTEAGDPANTLDRSRALPSAAPAKGQEKILAEILDYEVQPDGSTVRVWVALPTEDTTACGTRATETAKSVTLTITLCFTKTTSPPTADASPTAYTDILLKSPVSSRALLDPTGLLIPDLPS
ncbi:hypothetical protein LO762_08130 [Actinocorallia sp. API 0066]|uniref:hypothetical protein n=1 Tax=Actinocorallia sp. API 0066 TaxID=2896846 RepID=UPI001E41B8BE|nr:hypothetical protein [Actinocorallia sp. API 0066]MCD0449154.1 hypothetical protein [Actinocorallia sp. API 0066]